MEANMAGTSYPSLVVFDLDGCVYYPEMYTLDTMPSPSGRVMGQLGNGVGEGVVGVKSGRAVIRLYEGAVTAFQDIYNDRFPGMRAATASSADTPLAAAIGRKALEIIEVLPGITVMDVLAKGFEAGFDGNVQIGRTPPLSANKAKTHFPIIAKQTGIPYGEMLFFDDCNWGDNCGEVERGCPGVVGFRTPDGMTSEEWEHALEHFKHRNVEAPASKR